MSKDQTTGIPCMSADHIFMLPNVDRNRPLRIVDTEEEVYL